MAVERGELCRIGDVLTRRITVHQESVVPGRLGEEGVVVGVLVIVRPPGLGDQRLAERTELKRPLVRVIVIERRPCTEQDEPRIGIPAGAEHRISLDVENARARPRWRLRRHTFIEEQEIEYRAALESAPVPTNHRILSNAPRPTRCYDPPAGAYHPCRSSR